MFKIFRNFIVDPDRKNLYNISRELNTLRKRDFSLKSYFINLMYKKTSGNINNYVDSKVSLKIQNTYYRNKGKHPILEDKIAFNQYLKSNNILSTNCLGKLINGKLLIEDREYINEKEMKSQLEKLTHKYNSIFIKPSTSEGGKGICKLNRGEKFCFEKLSLSRPYIIEQALIQHPTLNKINPHSINTLRIITIRHNDKIYIPKCIFRMGTNTSFLDNASTGGIFISYDIYKNILSSTAYQFLKKGGKSFKKHPTSGFTFSNAQLPFNNEVIKLVTKAARSFKDIDLIGWDVAITINGPVIIEGNDNPHIIGMQICSLGLLNNIIYKEIFKDYIF